MMTIEDTHNRINELLGHKENWNGYNCSATNVLSVERAHAWIDGVYDNKHTGEEPFRGWKAPHVSLSENGYVTFEWWIVNYDPKDPLSYGLKITVYIDIEEGIHALRVWSIKDDTIITEDNVVSSWEQYLLRTWISQDRRIEACNKSFPCACCGYMSFDECGCYEICPLCFWEDDPVQLRFVDTGGANIALRTAQQNHIKHGAKREDRRLCVRPPLPFDVKDLGWHPLPDEEEIGPESPSNGMGYFQAACRIDPSEELYYWRRKMKTDAKNPN